MRRQLKTNSRALSTLVIVLIIIIVVGSVAAVLIAAALLGFWKPVVGSGSLDTKTSDLTDFTLVEVGWGFEVEIDRSDSYSISVTTDDNVLDYVEIFKTGDVLTIGLRFGPSYQDVTLKARITMPDLLGVEFSGGTRGTARGFASSHNFDLSLSGGSRITLKGSANDLTLSSSGGSHSDLSGFHVHDAMVNLSGGSHATINLDGRLEGDLSGGSHLKYIGNPTVDVNTSGGSTVGPQ